MPTSRSAAKPVKKSAPSGKSPSPYGYPYWEWVAREDPEMVIIGILAFRGRKEGVVAAAVRPSAPASRR